MANIEDLRRIRFIATSEGFEKAKTEMREVVTTEQQLGRASQQVASITTEMSRAQLSAATSTHNLRMRIDEAYRSEVQFTRGAQTLNRALDQGVLDAAQYGRSLDLLEMKFRKVDAAQHGMAGGLGRIGGSSMMLAGIAGGLAGMATGALSIDQLGSAAVRTGERLGELRDQAGELGLSAATLQALSAAGIEAGMSQDKLASALGKANVELGKASAGEGDLIEKMRSYAPSAAEQLRLADTQAERLNALARSFTEVRGPAERAALSVAAFGRSGAGMGRFFDEAGGSIAQIEANARAAGLVISDNLVRRGDEFADSIAKSQAQISTALTPALVTAGESMASMMVSAATFAQTMASLKAPGWFELLLRAPGAFNGLVQRSLADISRASNQIQQVTFGGTASGWLEHQFGAPPGFLSEDVLTPLAPSVSQIAPRIDSAFSVLPPGAPIPRSRPTLSFSETDTAMELNRKGLEKVQKEAAAAAGRQQSAIQGVMDKLKLEQQQIGLSAAAQRILNEQSQAGVSANSAQGQSIAALVTQLEAQKAAYEQLERFRSASKDIQFDRSMIGLSAGEQAIQQQLKGYGDLSAAQRDYLEGQLRINEQMRFTSDLGRDAFKGFAADMMHGVSATQALSNALGRMADKLLDRSMDQLWSGMFGGQSGGGFNIMSLFGLGGTSAPTAVAGGAPSFTAPGAYVPPTFAAGGYTGAGGRMDPAGIVHRGEYVMDAWTTSRLGVGAMDSIRQAARHGYADGGYVGARSLRQNTNDNAQQRGGDTYHIDARGADRAAIEDLKKTIVALGGKVHQMDSDFDNRSVRAVKTAGKRIT